MGAGRGEPPSPQQERPCSTAPAGPSSASSVHLTPPPQRNAAILEARTRGQTVQQIADAYGISTERVRQILRRSTQPRATGGGGRQAPVLERRLRGRGHGQPEADPLLVLRVILAAARQADYPFPIAWEIASEAALSYLPDLDATDWWRALSETEQAWSDAYARRRSGLAELSPAP
jgi:hypothetical protein